MTVAKSDSPMTLTELSAYLCVSQATVVDLVQNKKLPGVQTDREWRFQRKLVDAWLNPKSTGEVSFADVEDALELPLGELMPDSAIVHDMHARTAADAIDELAARAYRNRWFDNKPWFVGSERDRQSDALARAVPEGGAAFFHTRSRDKESLLRPFIIFGRSYEGIDCGAPDGGRSYLFFLLGCQYERLHLPVLGRLARLFASQPDAVARLRATTSPSKMRHTLLALDAAELAGKNKTSSAPLPALERRLDRTIRLRAIMRLNARRQNVAKTTRK
jgi:excisionase family DNA binding protein